MLGQIFIPIFALFVLLFFIGLLQGWLKRRKNKGAPLAEEEKIEFFDEETIGNVHNLNDQFNRARYMDKDGD